MRVDLHDRLRAAGPQEATQVVIRNGYGDVVAVAVETAPNLITVLRAGDDGFEALVALLGVGTPPRVTPAAGGRRILL